MPATAAPRRATRYPRGARGRAARGDAHLISTGRGVTRSDGLHTLYISPLKALAVDIARNLETPIAQMKLPIRVETRTGDTPVSRRQRQRKYPPDILLTTPEQLALLLSSDDAPFLFALAAAHRARRVARAGDLEARRSVVARAGAAVADRAAAARHRAVGDGGRAGTTGAVSGAAAAGRKRGRRYRDRRRRGAADRRDARHQGAAALGRPFGAACAGRDLRADQGATRPRWCSSTPAARPRCCSRNCGG